MWPTESDRLMTKALEGLVARGRISASEAADIAQQKKDFNDPFPLDGPFEKLRHHFSDNQRIRITHPLEHAGRTGTIISRENSGRLNVKLDSGEHYVAVQPDDAEPIDFPPVHSHAEDDDPKPQMTHATKSLLQSLEIAGLTKALEHDEVSAHDRVLAQRCLNNINAGQIIVDPNPFGNYEDENVRTLRLLCEKYAGGTLAKAKRDYDRDVPTQWTLRPDQDPEFSIGQVVQEKGGGRKGKIVALDYGFARVAHESGEFHCPCGYLETCAA